jgi:hypothetical protein
MIEQLAYWTPQRLAQVSDGMSPPHRDRGVETAERDRELPAHRHERGAEGAAEDGGEESGVHEGVEATHMPDMQVELVQLLSLTNGPRCAGVGLEGRSVTVRDLRTESRIRA